MTPSPIPPSPDCFQASVETYRTICRCLGVEPKPVHESASSVRVIADGTVIHLNSEGKPCT